MCLRSPPPVHRRCSRHGTAAPFLGARRAVPHGRSRWRALRSPVTAALLIAVALTKGALRLSSLPLCPTEASVPAASLYLSLTAAPPIAVAHAAEPLHPSSVPLRPLPQRPSRRCHRPPLISRPPITVALFVELLRPSSIPLLAGVAEWSRGRRCCSPSSLLTSPIAVLLVARPLDSSSAPSTRCRRAGTGGGAAPPPHWRCARSFHSPRDRCV